MTVPTITLGMRLALARRTAGITAKTLAAKLGVTDTTISRYENDATPVPASVLYAYQALCDVPLEWLEGRMVLTQEVARDRCTSQLPLWGHYAA